MMLSDVCLFHILFELHSYCCFTSVCHHKIHIGIKFKESACPKMYSNHNTNLRMQAQNDFEKDFFKLMNNSVFGKT